MDKQLLEILCCPVHKTPLRMLGRSELASLNRAIEANAVDTVAGSRVSDALQQGLISVDGKAIYRIEDDIPVLLAEEAIGTTQLDGLPPD